MDAKRKLPTSEKEILRILIQEVIDATAEKNEASDCFEVAMGQFPSGLPHPDGSQRIANSSQRLSNARKKVMTAHTRLSDFLDRGIVPEDLSAAIGRRLRTDTKFKKSKRASVALRKNVSDMLGTDKVLGK